MRKQELTIADFYKKVWQEYADPQSHPITAASLATQTRLIESRIREWKPGSILDLGCGPSPVVPAESSSFVVCADLVLEMLLQTRPSRQRPFVCLDAQELPFRDRCFDLIWCGLLADHIRDVRPWVTELLRVLAAGGTLGLASWDRSLLPKEKYPGNSRMRYYCSKDREEFTVPSYPTWNEILQDLKSRDTDTKIENIPVVPGSYVLQVAWVKVGPQIRLQPR